MKTQEEIFITLQNILEESFEIERSDITPETHLYEDLDLDSIDAVDLVVILRDITGKKIEPSVFKEVRTVQDIIIEIERLVNE